MSIEAKGIVKEYVRRERSFKAVDEIDLSISKGKITAVMGHSGSGKSTLLHILSGMITPQRGEVWIDGKNIFHMRQTELVRFRGEKIGIIPQSQSLISGLNIMDNIYLSSAFHGRKLDKEQLKELIRRLGLDEILWEFPQKLSGGEMKRVAIARALAGDPEYLFADEPTGELDAENAEQVMQIFRKQADLGKGILLITHDQEVAQKADFLFEMKDGKISPEKHAKEKS